MTDDSAEALDGVLAAATGAGVLTFALMPLAIPIIALTIVFTVPLLLIGVAVTIPVALVAAAFAAVRALVRAVAKLRAEREESRPAVRERRREQLLHG